MRHSWHVATAAEAIAAAQFARCGWGISVQYGANQPEYDLVAVNGDGMFKVSVKGSKDGGWGLAQSYLSNADYQGAIDAWLARHFNKTVFCFVQFKGIDLSVMPRLYLATPTEVGAWLKAAAAGRGDTILWEHHAWGSRAYAAGTVDRIPDRWLFTGQRIDDLVATA